MEKSATDPSHRQHSGAQLLAYAVKALYPLCQRIGYTLSRPGFIYSFAFPDKAGLPELAAVEEKIRGLIKDELEIQSIEMLADNLAGVFEDQNELFLAQDLEGEGQVLTDVMRIDSFFGPCPAPHLESFDGQTIKILDLSVEQEKIGGKIWHLVSIEASLQKEGRELRKFTKIYENWRKFRHQELGEKLQLFLPTSTGDWLWLPKGVVLRQLLEKELKKFWRPGREVKTPDIDGEFDLRVPAGKGLLHLQAWQAMGAEEGWNSAEICQYRAVDEERQSLLENGNFSRDESFVIGSENIVVESLKRSLQSIWETITILDIEVRATLISEPQRQRWRSPAWDRAQQDLEACAQDLGISLLPDPAPVAVGGPRIQLRYIDKLGNEWEGPFLQREVLTRDMLGEAGQRDTQWQMYSCSYLGPLETVVALLLESHNGALPLRWAPEQMRVLSVGEKSRDYATSIVEQLREAGYRAESALGSEALGEKIFQAQEAEVPLILVVGEKEAAKKTLSLRRRGSQEQKQMTVPALLAELGEC